MEKILKIRNLIKLLQSEINSNLQTHKDRFIAMGIQAPKGCLMYGPPGTGKTLLARACAAQTNATFLKLGATALVQMFIGDGARLVRDAFLLAKEKQPTIIFIDELGKRILLS